MRSLVWFRSDLRLTDNTALFRAAEQSPRGVVGVFLIALEQWCQEHDWGANKCAFVLRNVERLSERLEKKNIALLVRSAERFDDAPAALLGLAKEHDCDALWFNREYEFNERARDEAVMAAFARAGREVHACTDQVVLAPGSVLTNSDEYYKVFSPFKRAWHAAYENAGGADEGGVGEVLADPKRQQEMIARPEAVEPLHDSSCDALANESSGVDIWKPGEREASRRLDRFVDSAINEYDHARDHPASDGTSTLSPYLAAGVISPRQCVREADRIRRDKRYKGDGAETWLSELVWREFYKHVLIGFPWVSKTKNFRREYDDVEWRDDEDQFNAWREGRTGYPIVDAGMNQLREIGWMHNRLRMITAMFFSKHLLLPWWLGERHFNNFLVDADLASNNGGWQWSASTGTDAQPYFRIFNPWTQSKRFDADARYVRKWVPALEDVPPSAIHDPSRLRDALPDDADYPEPIVDHSEARERALSTFKSARSN